MWTPHQSAGIGWPAVEFPLPGIPPPSVPLNPAIVVEQRLGSNFCGLDPLTPVDDARANRFACPVPRLQGLKKRCSSQNTNGRRIGRKQES